jgi:glutamate/tyrosine decarboxylase-like PLP-dependent enzyme
MEDYHALLGRVAGYAATYLDKVGERPVAGEAAYDELRERLGGPLPAGPTPPGAVLQQLVAGADPGLVGSAGPRYFGFVTGGALPAAVAADWLGSAWDQNAGLAVMSPAAAVVEEVAGAWLRELLGLPAGASVGFTTGATAANAVCLAAARSRVLAAAGWDAERQGLFGAPPIRVLVGAQWHVSVAAALRFLGLGSDRVEVVPADGQGRMRAARLARMLRGGTGPPPPIVCAQVGNVNTGACDPVGEICEAVHEHGGWVHVDGAFGLWAAASPAYRELVRGVEHADSWATDAHKWLNVPYDCGLAFVADPAAHLAATAPPAAGYLDTGGGQRNSDDWVLESSRRARGFPVWAALRELGRDGVAELVDRCCRLARRFADALAATPGVAVLNDVVLNQVLVTFSSPDGDRDRRTREVIGRVQADGTCWLGATTWRGHAAMRISVSSWRTTAADVDRSVEAIRRAAAAA